MTEERWEEGGAWKNLRNRWLGSHATQDESKREEGSSFEATLWRNGDYASNGGGGVSSIISLRRQARIFIDYTSHPLKTASLIGKRTTVDEERKREQERERERERKVEGVVIYDTAARGSFHTFLQSLSSLSSWKELIFMSVLERTFCTHIAA